MSLIALIEEVWVNVCIKQYVLKINVWIMELIVEFLFILWAFWYRHRFVKYTSKIVFFSNFRKSTKSAHLRPSSRLAPMTWIVPPFSWSLIHNVHGAMPCLLLLLLLLLPLLFLLILLLINFKTCSCYSANSIQEIVVFILLLLLPVEIVSLDTEIINAISCKL